MAPEKQEREMRFVMDLDDSLMDQFGGSLATASATLETLQEVVGEHFEKTVGKNDYDWSRLAMRYCPKRVWQKLEKAPSLAMTYSDYGEYLGRNLFKELHPAMAAKWEAEQAKRN